MKITKTQQKYLIAIIEFFAENDQSPPVDALADMVGVHPNSAHQALRRLELAGAIERNSVGKYRFTRNKKPARGGRVNCARRGVLDSTRGQ